MCHNVKRKNTAVEDATEVCRFICWEGGQLAQKDRVKGRGETKNGERKSGNSKFFKSSRHILFCVKFHQKKKLRSFQLFLTLSSECCFLAGAAVQAWAGDCRALTRSSQFVSNLTPTDWLPHTLRFETTCRVTSPSECHVSVPVCLMPRQATSSTVFFSIYSAAAGQDLSSACRKFTERWEKRLHKSNWWMVAFEIHALHRCGWQRCASARASSLTERRITIGGRWATTHWAAETFLTCLVSLHCRLILLALPCKYTRVLVIKRAGRQTSSRFESSASTPCL